jgi:DNA repair exonuclease SbcCD ATPase subunit
MNELQSQIDKLGELDDKISKIHEELEDIQTQFSEGKDNLLESIKKAKTQISENLKQIKKKGNDETFTTYFEKLVVRMGEITEKFSFKEILSIKDDLKESVVKKISEISTSLSHLTNQKDQLFAEIEETKDHVKRLDRQIANTEKEIQILHKKEKIAERYRSYQNVFKEAQSIIRENASSILEEKILEMHKNLSTTDEFDKVLIDSNDYSLSVTPKGLDMNESYPAALYEGGGHRLMLGLSYKFSLGKVIGNAPFLLIDEPTEFMDVENRVNLLSNLPTIAEGTQILLITHQDVKKIQCDKKIGI